MKKKCCILYNEPGENAGPDERDVLDQVDLVEKQLSALGISSFRKAFGGDVFRETEEIRKAAPDFVFNLVESIANEGRLIYFAPALLELKALAYTGCPLESIFTTSSKVLCSGILSMAGIATPGAIATGFTDRLSEGSRYIIKPVWEDASLGIGPDSVFTYPDEYDERLRGLREGDYFIEPYLDGREFNISIISGKGGPLVLPPAEIEFRNFGDLPRIVDYNAKWNSDSFEYKNTVRVFPDDIYETGLAGRLTETAVRCWQVLGLRGYARVDVRCDLSGNPYVLEVNANPCISPDSGFIAACKQGGYSEKEAIAAIITDLNNR